MTVAYNIFSSTVTTTSQNLATLQIVNKGRIIGFDMDMVGLGAGATGHVVVEVTKNGVAGGTQQVSTTNNPQRELLVSALQTQLGNAALGTFRTQQSGLGIPVSPGDVLAMGSRLVAGTAYTSGMARATIYVEE